MNAYKANMISDFKAKKKEFNERVYEIVKGIRETISSEEKWCKGGYALDSYNGTVLPGHERACRWCISGAAFKASAEPVSRPISAHMAAAVDILAKAIGNGLPSSDVFIAAWNDSKATTWPDIDAALDRAVSIADAERKKS